MGAWLRKYMPRDRHEWFQLLLSVVTGMLAMLALTADLQEIYDSWSLNTIEMRLSHAVLHGSLLPTVVSIMLAFLFEALRRSIGAFWKDKSCIVLALLLTFTTMIAISFHHNGSFEIMVGKPLNLLVSVFMSIGFFFSLGI